MTDHLPNVIVFTLRISGCGATMPPWTIGRCSNPSGGLSAQAAISDEEEASARDCASQAHRKTRVSTEAPRLPRVNAARYCQRAGYAGSYMYAKRYCRRTPAGNSLTATDIRGIPIWVQPGSAVREDPAEAAPGTVRARTPTRCRCGTTSVHTRPVGGSAPS